MNIFCRD